MPPKRDSNTDVLTYTTFKTELSELRTSLIDRFTNLETLVNKQNLVIDGLKESNAKHQQEIIDLRGRMTRLETENNHVTELLHEDRQRSSNEIKSLTTCVLNLATQVEMIESKNRECNAIIKGIPTDANLHESLTEIKSTIQQNDSIICNSFRIGKPQNNTRLVKVMFANRDTRIKFSKAVQSNPVLKTKNIAVFADVPPLTASENYRLRKAKRDLETLNPQAKIELKNGELLNSDSVVDKFDLKNQIFR